MIPCDHCDPPGEMIAAKPGTSADATPYPDRKILPLFREPAIPTIVWCQKCWPWWRET